MRRADFSLKDGRIEYHVECEERLTAKQKYTLTLVIVGAVVLVALVKLVGVWAIGAAILAGFVGAFIHDFNK